MDEHEIKDRVLKLEFIADQHAKDCHYLHSENKLVQDRLDIISRTIFQVKWIALGGLSTAILTQIGLLDFIKGLL